VTLIWFVVWLIANIIGDHEPLIFNPVNWWAGLLLLAIAVDLAGVHARRLSDQFSFRSRSAVSASSSHFAT
jgi:hypothetical protein